MLSKRLHDALNAQINAELWSAYLYLSMSMDAENKGLKGVANWFFVQFREEQDHARILMNYINSRDAKVVLKPIEENANKIISVRINTEYRPYLLQSSLSRTILGPDT